MTATTSTTDGTDDNRSWNCGVEGPTDDADVLVLRARQQRNFLATLLLSQGVPMLLGGDEHGRTQLGNNNAWCQDNEIAWFDWDAADYELLGFTRTLIQLRAKHPVFRRAHFLTGRESMGSGLPDVWWFRPDGLRMTHADWTRTDTRALGIFLNGAEIPTRTQEGGAIVDDSFLVLVNAGGTTERFTLPTRRLGASWELVLSTSGAPRAGARLGSRAPMELEALSLVVLRRA